MTFSEKFAIIEHSLEKGDPHEKKSSSTVSVMETDEWEFLDWSYPKSKGAIIVHLGCCYKTGGHVPGVVQVGTKIFCSHCQKSVPDFIILTAKLNNVKINPGVINISRKVYGTYYRRYIF